MGIKLLSTGSYLPDRVLSNADLEKMVETSDEWITTRTGIRERRIAAPGQAASDLGYESARLALQRADFPAGKLDAIITATITGDHPFPSTGCLIQNRLGAKNAFALDISAACSGFLYGLTLARGLINSGQAGNVLLVASEVMSRVTDYTDRSTCVLLGDGSGAVLLTADKRDAVLGSFIASDGSFAHLLWAPAGGSRQPASHETVNQHLHYMKMEGQALFKVAVQAMSE
ncbi:MAG TPA: beta-ketoacyl-ACP synthase 3, partial [bacterium]|nr:beta-ketoacyl-ACP synthase 3 [bacterium]